MFEIKIKADNLSTRLTEINKVSISEGFLDINSPLPEMVIVFKKALLGLGFHQSIVDRIVLLPNDAEMDEAIKDMDDEDFEDFDGELN